MIDLSAALDTRGADTLAARLADLPRVLQTLVLQRARDAQERLSAASVAERHPERATGAASLGWSVVPATVGTAAGGGPNSVAALVMNDVRSQRGYNYPQALAVGTGQRAVPTTGFVGSHRQDWKGMTPIALHDVWEAEILIGFSLPGSILALLGAP